MLQSYPEFAKEPQTLIVKAAFVITHLAVLPHFPQTLPVRGYEKFCGRLNSRDALLGKLVTTDLKKMKFRHENKI
jgi:hypothetical protein